MFAYNEKEKSNMTTIYDYTLPTPQGEEVSLKDFEGKVLMVVNTATGCGFTPQYKDLEDMYEAFHDKGLEIIDVPCNQFAGQAPESDEEIHQFCQLKYNTQFPQYKKSDVNGENELPLYTWLKSQKGFAGFGDHPKSGVLGNLAAKSDPDWATSPDIKWNFTKFVVDREGTVVARFEPTDDMAKVENCIKALL